MTNRFPTLRHRRSLRDGNESTDDQMTLLEHILYPFRKPAPPPKQRETGFFTDTTLCIGCKACEVACKQWNQIPADGYTWSGASYDNTLSLSATTWRHVNFIEQFGDGSAHSSN